MENLQHCEALVAHMVDLCLHHERLVKECLVQEIAVDVGNHHVHVIPVLSLACRALEIDAFAEVEKVEIHRVVDMTQRVEVAESQLHRQLAVEGVSYVEVHELSVVSF